MWPQMEWRSNTGSKAIDAIVGSLEFMQMMIQRPEACVESEPGRKAATGG